MVWDSFSRLPVYKIILKVRMNWVLRLLKGPPRFPRWVGHIISGWFELCLSVPHRARPYGHLRAAGDETLSFPEEPRAASPSPCCRIRCCGPDMLLTHTHTHTSTHSHIYMHADTNTSRHTHIHTHGNIHTHPHAHKCIHRYVHARTAKKPYYEHTYRHIMHTHKCTSKHVHT